MRPVATFDTKNCAVRLELSAGLHVNVCTLMKPQHARELIAELEAALARIEARESQPRDLPKRLKLPDDYIAECEPGGTCDR